MMTNEILKKAYMTYRLELSPGVFEGYDAYLERQIIRLCTPDIWVRYSGFTRDKNAGLAWGKDYMGIPCKEIGPFLMEIKV
jgi:hypothetical protein